MWAKMLLTGNFLHSISLRVPHPELRLYGPTFEVASVKLQPTFRHVFHGGGGAVRTCSTSSTCPTRACRPDRSKDRVALLVVSEGVTMQGYSCKVWREGRNREMASSRIVKSLSINSLAASPSFSRTALPTYSLAMLKSPGRARTRCYFVLRYTYIRRPRDRVYSRTPG
jgi:hypothetical protein